MRPGSGGGSFANMTRQLPPLARLARRARRAAAERQLHWIVVDCAAAAVLLALMATHAATHPPQFGIPAWLVIAASAVSALPIAVRRIWPGTVFAAVLMASTLTVASGASGNPAVTVALALYTVTVSRPARWSLTALAAALAVTLPAEAGEGSLARPPLPGLVLEYLLIASTATVTAAWAAGAMQRRYAAHAAGELARRAVTDERLRIARELHDVISNAMTLITAKAAVTRYLMDSHPESARSALEMIEETGRDALSEMRRLLGVLRAGSGHPPASGPAGEEAADGSLGADVPAAGLAGLQSLAARATAAGVPTTVQIRGERELPPSLALPVYRIVQEAITNVIKHAAPARCTVQADLTGDRVTVDITDDGHARKARTVPPGGHGLIGMSERAALYGGDLIAGPRPEGGFRVTARFPAARTSTVASRGRRHPA
jgi:signal transduction histidine kinase